MKAILSPRCTLFFLLVFIFQNSTSHATVSLDPKYILSTTMITVDSTAGTGFFISTKHDDLILVTANHVFCKNENNILEETPIKRMEISWFVQGDDNSYDAENVVLSTMADKGFTIIRNATYDLAFFDLNEKNIKNISDIKKSKIVSIQIDDIATRRDFNETYLRPGEEIFVLGFPYGSSIRTQLLKSGYLGPIIRKCSVATVLNNITLDNSVFWIDGAIWPGNSGGPVVSAVRESPPERGSSRKGSALVGIVLSYHRFADLRGKSFETDGNNNIKQINPTASDESIDLSRVVPSFRLLDLLEECGILPEIK